MGERSRSLTALRATSMRVGITIWLALALVAAHLRCFLSGRVRLTLATRRPFGRGVALAAMLRDSPRSCSVR